ncbi:MAG: SPFH domain-containing protein [Pseudomonadota bacterium]|nr:SPFH domain-containing protein [Pseudomonadota bacterium]
MATIGHYPFVRHLRAEPNQYILHFRGGRLVHEGAGVSYWFNPLSASVAQLPVEDCETTFMLHERTTDFQEVSVQCTVRYRCVAHAALAARVNFAVSLRTGLWLEQPLERLASFWSQRAQGPARTWLVGVSVEEAVRRGAEAVRSAILAALAADAELGAMGLAVVEVQVVQVSATADVEKALQIPTREAIQQRADEAMFGRRALAVEKERAIKENELNTQIELAKKEEHLIAQNAANEQTRVRSANEADKLRAEAALERERLAAEAYARDVQARADGDAHARRLLDDASLAAEEARLGYYRDLPPSLVFGLAAQEAAKKITSIQHLNISPDLLGSTFQQMLRDGASK